MLLRLRELEQSVGHRSRSVEFGRARRAPRRGRARPGTRLALPRLRAACAPTPHPGCRQRAPDRAQAAPRRRVRAAPRAPASSSRAARRPRARTRPRARPRLRTRVRRRAAPSSAGRSPRSEAGGRQTAHSSSNRSAASHSPARSSRSHRFSRWSAYETSSPRTSASARKLVKIVRASSTCPRQRSRRPSTGSGESVMCAAASEHGAEALADVVDRHVRAGRAPTPSPCSASRSRVGPASAGGRQRLESPCFGLADPPDTCGAGWMRLLRQHQRAQLGVVLAARRGRGRGTHPSRRRS